MAGHSALDPVEHLVADPDVGKGAAHHHVVVTAPRPVAVEIAPSHLPLLEPATRRTVGLDRACGRNVVGGDRIPEHCEHLGARNVLDRARGHGHALEIGRVGDVGRSRGPGIGVATGDRDPLPAVVTAVNVGVARAKQIRMNVRVDQLADFVVRRPDILEIDRLAVSGDPDRLGREVRTDRALQGIGDHQRGRGEIIGATVGRYPAFEVPVARQDRDCDQILFVDRRADRFGKRARIADAGGAAIADEVETDRVEIRAETACIEIVGHHLASGGKAGFDPWLAIEPERARLAGDQAGGDQHRGIGSIGAAGDRGNHHVPVADVIVGARHGHARVVRFLVGGLELGVELIVDLAQRHPVLRPAWASDARHDTREVEFERVGEQGFRGRGIAPHSLCLAIGANQFDPLVVAPGQAEIVDGPFVDREKPAGSAIFRRHVGDRRSVGERHRVEPGAVEFDEPADHTLGAKHLGDGQHQVGRRNPLHERPRQSETDDFGDQHRDRLAEHRGLGLDSADAPTKNAKGIDHGGVAVGPDQRVGIRDLDPRLVGRVPHGLRNMLQIDLVTDPRSRRDDLKIGERLASPLEEFVALGIALIFDRHIVLEGGRGAELVDHHAMIDHQMYRDERIDLLRIAAERLQRIAHRGQVDHRRNPGEILHQDPCRAILDLARDPPLLEPVDHRLKVVARDGDAVLEPQQVFQQHLHRKGQSADIAKHRTRLFQTVIGVAPTPRH